MEIFIWPFMFLILPLPLIFRRLLRPVSQTASQFSTALRVPFYAAVKSYEITTTFNRKRAIIPLISAWILCVLAAARPVWYGALQEQTQTGRNIVLTIDASGSMQEQDFDVNNRPVSRLSLVKAIVDDFIQKRTGDNIALVIFGSEAFTYVPLTYDTKTAQSFLREIEPTIAGEMTAIGDALALSALNASKVSADSRIVILLSDGQQNAGNVSVPEAVQMADKLGVKVYTVGVGSAPKTIQSFFGMPQLVNPAADLDEKTLSDIASQTGGKYFRAKTTDELADIYDLINKLEPVEQKQQQFRPRKELFFIPLIGSLICLLWAFLKRRPQ